jgi:hypothetical protein
MKLLLLLIRGILLKKVSTYSPKTNPALRLAFAQSHSIALYALLADGAFTFLYRAIATSVSAVF